MKKFIPMLMASLLFLAGCGVTEYDSLEDYYDDNPQQLEELKAMSETETMKLDIEDNTIIQTSISEDYLTDADMELSANNMKAQEGQLSEYYNGLIESYEASTGIDGIKVRAELANLDGKVFYSKEFGG